VPDGVRVVTAQELGLPSYFEMCFKYDITELCTAVKPALLSLILTRHGESSVIYFDPDILVLRPLEELRAALASADIILVPHLLDPIPRDGLKPSEQDILIAGAYNLGFLAVKSSAATRRLLEWWADRLEDGCRVDPAHGLFVDQRWMDLVPAMFPSAAVLRDDTYDVAYWNLHSRMPERRGPDFVVGGRPLTFFHFSGFDPGQPQKLSKHQTRINVKRSSPLAELLQLYADLHAKHGHAVSSQWPYGNSRFSNGVPLGLVFRRLYLDLDESRRREFGDPFQAGGPSSFFAWATRPQSADGGLSPFLRRLYDLRVDLPSVFPDVTGKDRVAFLDWARTQGAREEGYPPEIVPSNGIPTASAAAVLPKSRDAEQPAPRPGVNVAGYLRNETGIGAVARGYVSALRSLGSPVALKDFSSLSPNRSADPTLDAFDEVHPHPINLVCANADQHFVVASHVGDAFFRNRHNIGVWFWELPEFPPEWHDRFAHYDEVWAPTSFIANTLAAVSPIPIVRIPAVLAADATGVRDRGRARLRVGPETFVWLFVFDFHSYFERKNPLGLIEAFKRAFARSEPVRLVIKCVNSSFDADAFASMRAAARGHAISIHDGYWSSSEMSDLLAACDGYASLHRSEGLGVPLAGAMALGKPVVATDWSGNTDFMNVGNSFPLRYELVALARDVGPYRAGCLWADPSVEDAADRLRQVFERGKDVTDRAEAGRRTIESQYSVAAVAHRVESRLAVIRGRLSEASAARPGPEAATPAAPPATANRYDLTPVLPPLDLQTSQHGRLGRWGKRAAGFLLRYHDFHQQRVNAILASSIGDLASRLGSMSERVERAQAQERTDADNAAHAMSALGAQAQSIAGRLDRLEGTAAPMQELELARKSIRALEAEVQEAFGRFAGLQDVAALTGQTAAVARRVEEGIEAASQSIQALEHRLADSQEGTARDVQSAQQHIQGMTSSVQSLERHVEAVDEDRTRVARAAEEQIQGMTNAIQALEGRLAASHEQLAASLGAAKEQIEAATKSLGALESRIGGGDPVVQGLRSRLEDLSARTAGLGYRFAVRPYMGVDPFGVAGDLNKPMEYGPGSARPTFEDVFRGPRELIAERQRAYLPLLKGIDTVVDLGCGRGEFLDLMAEAGIPAVGVEKSPELVAAGRARGLNVVKADVLRYLRARRRGSLGAIFSAQFIEHLPPEKLDELLALSLSRLRRGGLFIAETPNPESFEALKTFHVDLTHHKPIYPQVLLHMCLERGYSSARIFYPVGGGFTQQQYETAGEYAVVAVR
jgi:glycosyltransferase involved in cell wall biosynthesis/SAM-dependent methyltransferase